MIFVILSVVPTILVIIVANEIYSRSLYRQSGQLIQQNARQHDLLLTERLNNYEDSFFELITTPGFYQSCFRDQRGGQTVHGGSPEYAD